jgi:hypothetical protein
MVAHVPANGHLTPQQQLLQKLSDVSIHSPCVPYSSQRAEERRVSSMLQRSEAASQAMLQALQERPFVLGKWRRPVAPAAGFRAQMFESSNQHSQPVGTGLSDAAMHKLYNRQVRMPVTETSSNSSAMGTLKVHKPRVPVSACAFKRAVTSR